MIKMSKFDFIIGNPPFTKSLPKYFINKLISYGDIIFLLPTSYDNYNTQAMLGKKIKLIYSEMTPDAYSELGLRTCIQWYTLSSDIDLRKRTKPPIKHQDFIVKSIRKFPRPMPVKWDFAISNCFWVDYSKFYYPGDEIPKSVKWLMVFTCSSEQVKNILLSIDYKKLAHKKVSVPSFWPSDVVTEYERIKNERSANQIKR